MGTKVRFLNILKTSPGPQISKLSWYEPGLEVSFSKEYEAKTEVIYANPAKLSLLVIG